MYKEHFGLKDQPFGLTPNTAFFLNAQGHREAFNLLQVALANGEGFIKVVGEVGTGKTMLCRKLLNTLDDNYYTAYIPNPFLNPTALYRAIAGELGIKCKSRDGINEYQNGINERLVELVAEGKQVVLVVDEAQAMPPKSLEALRLISNLETETTKLIHIVLFGQPELDRLLAHDSLRQLLQRVTFSYDLPPLDMEGTSNYIQHRVATAGYNGAQLFNNSALQYLYKASKGVPRLVNILCHKALMAAYGKGNQQVTKAHVASAIKDTEGVDIPGQMTGWLFAASVAVGLGVVLGVFFTMPGGFR
ncbi:MAG: AAA family ATPase [Oceanicoccus sp.]|uniref:ExeA family protein n=1 Tax=Oceanicoccus sp. TaxID=2691044 RepID=UPI002630ED32|nr:AAA family ATPase [Oceanicoccus sp.]MCP3908384.1 AAA family ATPase [Oceanicoccus sp.]